MTTDPGAPIGRAGQPVRVLAFSGGGFATAMQLGVTHALLVTRSQPPDVVAGISAGAIHATALADVLRAGGRAPDDGARLLKQVEVFTTFLEEELAAPVNLLAALLPDAYQVESKKPLRRLESSLQTVQERAHRTRGVYSRDALIGVINDIVGVQMTIGDATRLARALLGFRAAGEARSPIAARWREMWELGHVCWVCLKAIVPLASLMRYLWGPIARHFAKQAFEWIGGRAYESVFPNRGSSAASIMYRTRIKERVQDALLWLGAVVINGVLWLALAVGTIFLGLRAIGVTVAQGFRLLFLRTAPPSPVGGPPSAGPNFVVQIGICLFRAFLQERDLASGLLEPEVLRAMFVRVFDPTYYGRVGGAELDQAIERDLRRPHAPRQQDATPRRIADFTAGALPIEVGIVAADLATGELELLPPEVPLVDALLAATALIPFFEVQPIPSARGTRWYVDGMNVSREPTQVVMEQLRDRIHPAATEVMVYPVSHLTSKGLGMAGEKVPFPTWVEVARRATELQKFRDATLDWKLTKLVTRMLPEGVARHVNPDPHGRKSAFLRAQVRSIEPDVSLRLDERVFEAVSEDARRDVILAGVADGCRATMETLFTEQIRYPAHRTPGAAPRTEVECWTLVEERIGHASSVPGSSPGAGPGLPRICAVCAYRVRRVADEPLKPRSLRILDPRAPRTDDWPLAAWLPAPAAAAVAPKAVPTAPATPFWARPPVNDRRFEHPAELAHWPKSRSIQGVLVEGRQRPVVSLLFSGGVFRGVYLVGVVNALIQAGLSPDIVAGASVGSITAVLAADIFARPAAERPLQMARFASVFLSLDRLILTDTFADFIRTFTVRASQARFSPRDLDRILRRYDEGETDRMTADARRVTAGLERLFYLTPLEFMDLVRAIRYGRTQQAATQVVNQLHKWLRRDRAEWEVLGSEQLALITDAYVLQRLYAPESGDRSDVPFQSFLRDGIYLLSTVTNLTLGELQLLGDVLSHDKRDTALSKAGNPPSLLEGILASSAFPGIFRPRWSWEVFRGGGGDEQFTDGGVMDNLPLDAVAHFIHSTGRESIVPLRPALTLGGAVRSVPHLLFTASLEADSAVLAPGKVKRFESDWYAALGRTRQLGYNRKLNSYKSAQHTLRSLYHGTPGAHDLVPADLEVLDVRPQWLCSTFAFHPMMGFRRQRQAESIAHGCASTFTRLQEYATDPEQRWWVLGWGIDMERVERADAPGLVPRRDVSFQSGKCVFRNDATCPFSEVGLRDIPLEAETRRGLQEIYAACRRPETHQRQKE